MQKGTGEGTSPPPAIELAQDNTPCYKATPLTHPSQVRTLPTNELQDYINDQKKNSFSNIQYLPLQESQDTHIQHS